MTGPNPYQPSRSPAPPQEAGRSRRSGVGVSVIFILAGLFFCVASFYILFGHGIDGFWASYRPERFPAWFMIFYGTTSGLVAIFHLSCLRRGRPEQAMAGIYANGIGLVLTSIAVAGLEFFS